MLNVSQKHFNFYRRMKIRVRAGLIPALISARRGLYFYTPDRGGFSLKNRGRKGFLHGFDSECCRLNKNETKL